jgi:hypothetical protein
MLDDFKARKDGSDPRETSATAGSGSEGGY